MTPVDNQDLCSILGIWGLHFHKGECRAEAATAAIMSTLLPHMIAGQQAFW